MKRRGPARLLLALAVTAHLHCGGGGGGRGGGGGGPTVPPTPTPLPPSITFTPSGTGGVNSLSLVRVSGDQSSIVLSLEATSVTDLYGVAFDLRYPAAAVDFVAATEGSFLDESGAVDTSLQVVESPSGTLVVGLSRLGQVAGRSGTGSLLRFEFTRLATGSGDLTFDDNQAFNANGGAISGVVWSAGRIDVP
jgi:predicted outer membrane repeat protein